LTTSVVHLLQRPGPMTLNGPIVEGFAVLVEWQGHHVLVTAPTAAVAQAVGESLSGRALAPACHALTGQPPWYQNQTKSHDLSDTLREVIDERDPRPRSRIKVRVGDAESARPDQLRRRQLLW